MSQCDCFSMGVHNCPEHGPAWARRRADEAIDAIMGYSKADTEATIKIAAAMARQWGFLFRWRSAWVGLHYSVSCKRYCLNLLPCCTFWWTQPGGQAPDPRKM